MRATAPRVLAAAIIAILSLGAPSPALAADSGAGACLPEATVCQEIRGVPGDYRYWFRIQPAPTTAALSFTVNDVPTGGSVSTAVVGTALEGEFIPAVVLVAGDTVCMRVSGFVGEYCATTP
ncbi:hypothetical protein FH608_037885 [Nonomuraea phyllanthi]|uniref:Uncharacterized protein n=1 Tax=Nonomuraea phyllanthi TaxID=2219224 RepID=A0A5C4VRH7_9ACTN|nr:hypothetical protein [Nonomuraea phyllanthi]KAB8189781.1 hypothetical protein FH608_037885 [Nonomuraea phyllanthi]